MGCHFEPDLWVRNLFNLARFFTSVRNHLMLLSLFCRNFIIESLILSLQTSNFFHQGVSIFHIFVDCPKGQSALGGYANSLVKKSVHLLLFLLISCLPYFYFFPWVVFLWLGAILHR